MKKMIVRILMILIQYLFFRTIYTYLYTKSGFPLHYELLNAFFAIYIVFNLREGIYSLKNLLIWEGLRKQLTLSLEYIATVWVVLYFYGSFIEGRVFGHLYSDIALSLLFLLFNWFSYILFKIIFRGFLKKNVVIIGVGETAKSIATTLNKNKLYVSNLLGFIDPRKKLSNINEEISVKNERIIGEYENLEKILKENNVDEVIIAIPEINQEDFKKLVYVIGNNVEKVTYIPKLNQAYTFMAEASDFDGILGITSNTGVIKTPLLIVKRMFDILVSLVGLFIFAIIYLVFARKIKADGGKAMYAQERIGKDLKPFKIYKFRSMYSDADKRLEELLKDDAIREEYYRTFKLKNDPRITKVGAFLRKTSLDEFPQFINVFKGDMSLIGPRPIVKKELENYYGDEVGKKVFAYKPGITGMWQSHGRSNVEDYDERIELDLYYTRNWSLWLDMMILSKTINNVLTKDDAY